LPRYDRHIVIKLGGSDDKTRWKDGRPARHKREGRAALVAEDGSSILSRQEEKTMHLFARTALAAAILTVPCQAADNKYGSAAGWDIFVNSQMGPGCFIRRVNPDGDAQVLIGIDATAAPAGYLAVYSKKPQKITGGEKLSVVFDVDGQKYTGVAKGQELKGFDGAFVRFNNLDFIYDLAKKKALTITAQGRKTVVVNLTGTDDAFKALRECQAAQK
jgi:hypothetical protein